MDILNASFAGVTLILVVVGVLFSARQTRELAKQTRISNSVGIATVVLGFNQLTQGSYELMLRRPELRPYFFGNRPCRENDPNRAEVMLLAEVLGDVLEYELSAVDIMPEVPMFAEWHGWPRNMVRRSPVLRELIDTFPEYWPALRVLLAQVREEERTGTAPARTPTSRPAHPLRRRSHPSAADVVRRG